jgi:hypothetical protein
VSGRDDDDLHLRGQNFGNDDAELVQHDGGRDVLVLHDDERHVLLLLQYGHDGHVQDGNDGDGLHDDLHFGGQELREDDSSLLRLHERDDDAGHELLHDDERHAGGVLRLLIK